MSILKAVLGPTNTGKTHYALERMMGHATGMIGLPLRLLAREVYDRVVAVKGEANCALITGEERLCPKTARYFVCTVESMPVRQQAVDFLAIDEIQLAEDRDRGHVFTDRILHARGRSETLLLGSDTMRPILRALDLHVETDVRERFSDLGHGGKVKVTKLPKRTAIVAFSADEVYAIAELLRRKKGGAAVVMGALSPRTRNAQVQLYQDGEVDYLVATDAIGMGLNLDVDVVAFAGRTKFDGLRHRALSAAECGQIAGRAGRFRSEGTFVETADCPEFGEEMVHAITNHTFDPVDELQWRNGELDFHSIKTLIASLARPSGRSELRQNPDALDEWVLRRMAEDEMIGPEVRGERKVRRLWDLARLPDFRKAGHDGHGRLVLGLAETLADPDARLGDTAMAKRLDALAHPRGDIASLQQRLAAIRTWTYAAHREDWLENPAHWREKTRDVEDALSDALHAALTARFVDKRTTALLAGMKKEDALVSEIDTAGEITVEGHLVGRLHGLTFEPATSARTLEGKAVRGAAVQALRPILTRRLKEISEAGDGAFQLSDAGAVVYGGAAVARLAKGSDWMSPRLELIGGQEAEDAVREAARNRVQTWVDGEIASKLPSHSSLKSADMAKALEGLARGIAFRLLETGAAIDLRGDDPSHRIETAQRDALRAVGIRTGRVAAYVPDAQKPAPQRLIASLRTVFDADACQAAPEGAGSFSVDADWTDPALAANGYLRFGRRAVRADLAERLAWEVSKRRKEAGKNLFVLPAELASIVSCPSDDFPNVLKGLGLVPAEKDPETGSITQWRYAARSRPQGDVRPSRRGRAEAKAGAMPKGRGKPNQRDSRRQSDRAGPRSRSERPRQVDPNSPFAALAVLLPEDKPKKKRRPKKKDGKPAAKETAGFVYRPFQ
ncbi:MAG: helicase-related protein [Pseudomonadota bacterium]